MSNNIRERKVVAIGGPTSSGKTDLGKMVADKFNGVVVSVDSRQVYSGLDLGTGKDKSFHQEMIDVAPPSTEYSITQYTEKALKIIDQIIDHNKLPILVGGTGYYLDSLIYQKKFPNVSNAQLVRTLDSQSSKELYQQLEKLDPESALRSQMNRRKIIRALEIVKTTGKAVPKLKPEKRFNHLLIILDPGVDIVSKNIEVRLTDRLSRGLVEEVKRLREKYSHDWLWNLGLEYRYISDLLDGKISETEMKETLLRVNNNYAKRQRTWFRRYEDAAWVSDKQAAIKLISEFLKL